MLLTQTIGRYKENKLKLVRVNFGGRMHLPPTSRISSQEAPVR